jgi:hypothetical protein
LAGAQAANAGIINFDDLALADYGDIAANYADHGLAGNGDSRVGVIYSGNSGGTNQLDFWNNDYGDLGKVAFTPTNGTNAKITLVADAGWLIRFISFDLAGWPNADLSANLVANIGGFVGYNGNFPIQGAVDGGPEHSSFGLALFAGAQSASIEWGTDWNVGIDNIFFEVIVDPNVGRVPEPFTPALIGAALGAMALIRRRKTA